MTDMPVYTLDRTFDAPPELVWKTWADPALFARWYGPGAETIIHQMDLRAGGQLRLEMRWGEKANFQRGDYSEVSPYESWPGCTRSPMQTGTPPATR